MVVRKTKQPRQARAANKIENGCESKTGGDGVRSVEHVTRKTVRWAKAIDGSIQIHNRIAKT